MNALRSRALPTLASMCQKMSLEAFPSAHESQSLCDDPASVGGLVSMVICAERLDDTHEKRRTEEKAGEL